MRNGIFISYRRDDAAAEARLIAKALRAAVGDDFVFMDTSSIDYGTAWPEGIRQALTDASFVVVVIGPGWLVSGIDEWGLRRIDQSTDWVRSEIATALKTSEKTILPVLVRDAKMPPARALPECISHLSSLQKIDIRGDHWDNDITPLVKKVSPKSADTEATSPQILDEIWDRMTPDLQDAFALAATAARREGKRIVSTRTLFAALQRLHSDRLDEIIRELPHGSLPNAVPDDVTANPVDLSNLELVSSCVQNSLEHFARDPKREQKLSSEELFVDIARHGNGASVHQLRTHGVDITRINEIVRQLGWTVMERPSREASQCM